MEKQAMQAMRTAFDVLDTVTISTSEVDKMYAVRNELRRAYAILAQDVEHKKLAETEVTDGGQSN
nr:MAG TPA: hypothetical protein [Caudoviricetes sp.]